MSAAGVYLPDVDGTLTGALGEAELAKLRRHLRFPAVRVPAGRWDPPAGLERAVALLVIEGILVLEGESRHPGEARLFGPDDLIDARSVADEGSAWRALSDAHVAVLDSRLLLAARYSPELALALTRRLFDGQAEQHTLAVIRALPRVEQRILAYLTHVASRWGRVTTAGLILDLPVTHELLGRLVAARRPTVSLALANLRDEGSLVRLDDDRWLLGAGHPSRAADAAQPAVAAA
jgi:CRP/FNR family transcriptional regulator, cyclic AMP receptor protein